LSITIPAVGVLHLWEEARLLPATRDHGLQHEDPKVQDHIDTDAAVAVHRINAGFAAVWLRLPLGIAGETW
jgi:hypothetical protein